jgi:large subunit ribosomal protein L17
VRHRKQGRTLDRTADARRALVRQLASSLIWRGRVTTTTARARAVRPFIDRSISTARTGGLAARRILLRSFTPPTVTRLLVTVGPQFRSRPGGYTRVVRGSQRRGDGAQQVIVELLTP